MRNSVFPLVLLLPLLACEQQSVAPTVNTSPDFVSADINKNTVIRFQNHLATSWTDPTNGLRATHTTFPIPLDGEPEPDCGPQDDLAPIDFQQVGVVDPVDFFASELHINGSGPVWVIGPGTIRYLDNGAFGVAPGETGANSWGFIASGTLTTPDGRQLSYQGTSRYVVKATSGEPSFFPVVERVNLR
jgi:hypothetical protein